VEACGFEACELCPASRFEQAPCNGLLALLRGVRCNV
jgi:hypothetical protein